MPYLVVENFSLGVDRRRPRYAGTPGSMWDGINGHLSRGGDFEKRKAFVLKYQLPPGSYGLLAHGDELCVFSSKETPPGVPAGIVWHQISAPNGAAMTDLLDATVFNGKSYVVAQYADGGIHHFFDYSLVEDWEAGTVSEEMTDLDGVAAHLAGLIHDPDVMVGYAGPQIVVEALADNKPFTLSALAQNKVGGVDDQTAVVAQLTAPTPGTPAVTELLAAASLAIVGGTANPGVNQIVSIKVNGVEVLGAAIDHTGNNTGTATAVAAQCAAFSSTPEYTIAASGAVLSITALAGTGAGPNGFSVLATVTGDVVLSPNPATLTGGRTASAAVLATKQKSTVTLGGSFEPGDRFTITVNGVNYGAGGNPQSKGHVIAKTYRNKVYAGTGSEVAFSAGGDPTGWTDGVDVGAGRINMQNQHAGSEEITGLEAYQSNMAVFSKNAIQIWNMDPDPALNTRVQVIGETGTFAHASVRQFGDIDVFYLSRNGIRSLRARDVTNTAGVNDVGTFIDNLVLQTLAGMSDEQKVRACATVEPVDGRYWLALGGKIFVFTYFPSSKISGWSCYEPGFTVDHFAVFNDRLYARSGDDIYLYGGEDDATYDSCPVQCQLPFLVVGKPGTYKEVNGVDIAATGAWTVQLLPNPRNELERVHCGTLDGVTYPEANIGAAVHTTHIAADLANEAPGFASLSSLAIYYQMAEDE